MRYLYQQQIVVIELFAGLANQIISTMRAREIDHIVVDSLDEKVLDSFFWEHIVIVAEFLDDKLLKLIDRLQYLQNNRATIYLVSNINETVLNDLPLKDNIPIRLFSAKFSPEALCNILCKRLLNNKENVESINSLFYFHSGIKQLLYHEFNTPMTAIVGFTELLKTNESAHSEISESNYIEYIEQSSDRLIKTVKKFRNWYSLNFFFQETLSAIYKERIDIVQCLKDVANSNSKKFKRAINFNIDVCSDSVFIVSDRYFITIILYELIDNAFRHSDDEISISFAIINDKIFVEIIDKGSRIKADVLNTHLPFIQYGRKKYEQQGVGVGLSLVMMSAQLLNVIVKFSDEKNIGIKSQVVIPLNI